MASSGTVSGVAGDGANNINNVKFVLGVRMDNRPVQGCELTPYAFLNTKGVNCDNSTRAKALDANPHHFSYKWYRGQHSPLCCNENCPRSKSYAVDKWCKAVLECGYPIRCAVCERGGLGRELSSFCSPKCLKAAWKTHCAHHSSIPITIAAPAAAATSPAPAPNPALPPAGKKGRGGQQDKGGKGGKQAAAAAAPTPPPAPANISLKDSLVVGGIGGDGAMSLTDPTTVLALDGDDDLRGAVVATTESEGGSGAGGASGSSAAATGVGRNFSHVQWVQVGTESSYSPTAADVGCYLRLELYAVPNTPAIAAAGSIVTPLAGPLNFYTEAVLATPAPPPKRNLVTTSNATSGSITTNSVRFRLVSYNVLAELYATKAAYPHCDSWTLSWPYRFNVLTQELYDVQGDIICLQEVQADHFEFKLQPRMLADGYEGVFKQKSRESMGQYGKVDGCATFWKKNKFQLVQDYTMEFNECAVRSMSNMQRSDMEGRRYLNRLTKDNIAQVLILESVISRAIVSAAQAAANSRQGQSTAAVSSNLSSVKLCVVNTHIYSNQSFPDVKLWQTWTLLQEIDHVVNLFQSQQAQAQQQQVHTTGGSTSAMISQELGIVICGDFNSEPSSAVYELLKYGQIESNHPELSVSSSGRDESSGGNGGSAAGYDGGAGGYDGGGGGGRGGRGSTRILPDLDSIHHNLDLSSMMDTVFGNEPMFTNYTTNYKGTLDYVFFTPSTIKVLAANAMPDEPSLRQINGGGMPNVRYPSDHLMLCCDLSLAVNVTPNGAMTSSNNSNSSSNLNSLLNLGGGNRHGNNSSSSNNHINGSNNSNRRYNSIASKHQMKPQNSRNGNHVMGSHQHYG